MDFSLIETLRWEPDNGFLRLERHLARLTNSASTLGFPNPDGARAALEAHMKGATAPLRMRLEFFASGRIEAISAPFVPLPANSIWRLGIAGTRLSSSDPLLRHKTSRREIYYAARAEFPVDQTDEVILLNERDEVCEGTITSLFVDDGEGCLLTPPLACGLLAGVLRADLLDRKRATEARLTLADLAGRTLYVGNSLRGLVRAEMI
ncbi:aminotransferase class IV family protein [Rhizobiaceae bacterium n13]|uniref:aminotransferase class IV family protein n=1 Tax=Ferirhizobium litorale TaxID=2927786 RepID=UPI0024B309E9|nr:aminotransferase class IV family protein [Fererhizobium litorale]MDI7860525.1 aminotransferase class IV family protein [Fererhizobium litorale]